MTKEEVAKKIILQEGNCNGVDCSDCIENKDGENPCDYAENLGLESGDKEYRKAKAEFCKQWLKENEINWNDYIGKEVYVSNFDKEFQCKNVSIFEEYRQDLSYPFVVRTRYKEGFALESYKYIKLTTEKEHKAYARYKDIFKNKKVRNKFSGDIETIVGYKLIYKHILILQSETGVCTEVTCGELFLAYEWLDGSICGEEIK